MSINTTFSQQERMYINAWNLIPGIGAQKLFMIATHCGSFYDAWHFGREDLARIGFSENLITAIIAARIQIDPAQAWHALIEHNITLLPYGDPAYPQKFKAILSPPFCLYVRGNCDILSTPSVAVVGSRKISEYGTRATASLVTDIARSGITVVSGLALGTDALAHRTTLACGGTTIAIIAGGVDDPTIAPHSHISLARSILDKGGAIISEYPVGTTPHRGTFPARNRLMAGLTDVTLIIEAAKDSGTLITAEHAHQFNKKIFALPGSIFAQNAVGPHELICNGTATILTSGNDIITLFYDTHHAQLSATSSQRTFADPDHAMIHSTICQHADGIQIDKLIKVSGLDTTIVSMTLTMLELDGVVKNIGNQTYIAI